MKRTSLAVSVGLVAGLVGLSAQTAPVAKTDRALNDRTVTVTGCVAEGAEAGSYTLTSAKIIDTLPSSSTTAGTAGTLSTEKSASIEHRAWYQLKGGDLKPHVGHKVEATGTTRDKPTDTSASVGTTDTIKDTPSTLTVTSVKVLSTTCR